MLSVPALQSSPDKTPRQRHLPARRARVQAQALPRGLATALRHLRPLLIRHDRHLQRLARHLPHARRSIVPESGLKPTPYLIADLLGDYVGPLCFSLLFVAYKVIHGTHFQTLKNFENAYFLPEFDREPRRQATNGWSSVLQEVWSLLK